MLTLTVTDGDAVPVRVGPSCDASAVGLGVVVGVAVGVAVGDADGVADGDADGVADGEVEGVDEVDPVGVAVGDDSGPGEEGVALGVAGHARGAGASHRGGSRTGEEGAGSTHFAAGSRTAGVDGARVVGAAFGGVPAFSSGPIRSAIGSGLPWARVTVRPTSPV